MEDNSDMSFETAVVWAVSAKNTLLNNSGYSPNMNFLEEILIHNL